MTPIDTAILLSVILIILVFLGVRVAFATALVGFVGLFLTFAIEKNLGIEKGFLIAAKIAGQIPHAKVSSYELALIPIFVLIGFLAYYAGLTTALFSAAKKWLGWLPGGLAVATIFSSAGFAAVSGASTATSAVFARIAIPEMLQLNYDKRLAAGVVAVGGTLAALIPPSAILVIYAIIVEASVGKLLLAAIVPGIFSALVYAVLIVVMATFNKKLGPPVKGFTWAERIRSIPGTLPIFAVIMIVFFCIYFGWGTATEAGALGGFVVFVIAVRKRMRWPDLNGALTETAKLTTMIFAMIWGVMIFVRYLGFAGLPDVFASWVAGLDQSPMLTLIMILMAYVVIGMFMDAIGMMILTLPITFPAVIALNGGLNVTAEASAFGMTAIECGIWFGIVVVKMAEICLVTPPIGLNCFVVAGARSDLTVQDVFKGVVPFFLSDGLTIAVLIGFPGIVLWLPRLIVS